MIIVYDTKMHGILFFKQRLPMTMGKFFECKNEEEIVLYMAKSNLSRQQQGIETPFITAPLVDIFGY